MKTLTLGTLLALAGIAVLPGIARADDPAPAAGAAAAAPPASPLSFNVGVVTDYRYRGISQSRLDPALQGGADYAAASGAYVGTWLSTISWIKDAGKLVSPNVDSGNTPAEWDLYGGYKGEIAKDVTYDVGGLYYLYVSNNYANVPGGANANTFEIYGAITYGLFTAKYSHSLTNLFGYADSKGSGYLDLSANVDLGSGWSVAPHIGHQTVHNTGVASYTDYSLTLGKDLGNGVSLSAALLGTDADKSVYITPAGKFTGKSSVVLGAKYTF
jgi:uncharacterized protein (TIGR02001 family)